MARFLAVEWNENEARLAIAGSHGEQVVVEHAFSVDLRLDQADETPSAADAGKRIAAALATRHLGRLDTLVAIGRTNIELRKLSLPPVPDEELPELIRFQALREFNELDADWPLDFIPIDESPDEPRNVLAAAIDPRQIDETRETCQEAGLKPRRLILRPCSAASLLCQADRESPRPITLLVDLLVDEADLTVVRDDRVIFLRTARLPGDPLVDPAMAELLFSEIRRTMAAARNQLGGQAVESIALCGSDELHTELAAQIRGKFGTPTKLFDPFAGLELSAELERALPDHPGRFAPLLGMLLDELKQNPHSIDFLHPRRPPRPPSQRNLFTSIGLGVAVLLAIFVIGSFVYGKRLDGEIARLHKQSLDLDKELEAAREIKDAAGEIETWQESDFCWLDEISWLSERFPPAQEAMLTDLQMRTRLREGRAVGVMEITGLARDTAVIGQGEMNLRDERHEVDTNDSSEEKSKTGYAWRFSASLFADHEAK